MDWNKLLDRKRLKETKVSLGKDDVRSEFERDADRVMFCGPFRRMGRKTQVHPLAANDHVHTRLTHSIETGQLGKTLGRKLHEHVKKDLPSDVLPHDLGAIVQAACLAHDIGNPPFGHAGEEAMVDWFRRKIKPFEGVSEDENYDLGRFDGNAQGFRILTQIENHLFNGGLQLTHATLATFLKYPIVFKQGAKKFSVFLSEAEILAEVADAVGLPTMQQPVVVPGGPQVVNANNEEGPSVTKRSATAQTAYARHPLVYLVEAADDICYCVLDIEDAVELGILEFDEAVEILLKPFSSTERTDIKSSFAEPGMFRVNFARMRGRVFRLLGQAAVDGFLEGETDIMAGRPSRPVLDLAGAYSTDFIKQAKDLGLNRIYKDVKKVEVELGSFATMDTLLSAFCDAGEQCAANLGSEKRALPWKAKLVMSLLGDHAPEVSNAPESTGWDSYACIRRAIDFVSGMTDNYATYLAKQIGGMAFTGLQRP